MQHDEDSDKQCDYCKKKKDRSVKYFTRQRDLNRHIRRVHLKQHRCQVCDYRCGTRHDLLLHERRIHHHHHGDDHEHNEKKDKKAAARGTRIRSFSCSECLAPFITLRGLERHKKSKHNK